MKKISLLSIVLFLCTAMAMAQEFEVDGIMYKITDGTAKTIEVIFNWQNSYTGDVVIPSTVDYEGNTYTVTSISNWGPFSGPVTSITIPQTILNLNSGMLMSGDDLTTIIIHPDNPNYQSVDGVVFSKDQTTLVFYPSGKGGEYVIPNTVTTIGDQAFSGNRKLSAVTIPSSVTTINLQAFSDCSALSKVSVKQSTPLVLSATELIFSNVNKEICILEVPVGAKAAYQAAEVWKDFTLIMEEGDPLPVGASFTVGDIQYVSTSNTEAKVYKVLTDGDVTIPETVNMQGVDYTVTAIRALAVSGVNSLSIPASVTDIEGVMQVSTAVTVDAANPNFSAENGVLFNKDKTTLILYPSQKANTDYVVPASVTTIGQSAFYQTALLKGITLPDGLTTIQGYAFQGSGIESMVLPNSVTTVESHAFYGAQLNTITLSENMTTISASLFQWNQKLNEIVIPEGITTIAPSAFSDCKQLKSVTLPSTLTAIGEGAFSGCEGLLSLTVNMTTPPTDVTDNVFTYVGSITYTNCTLKVPAGTKAAYQAANVWKNFTTIIEQGEPLPVGAVFNDNGIVYRITSLSPNKVDVTQGSYSGDVVIPTTASNEGLDFNVTGIESKAFLNQYYLTSVTIPQTVEAIGARAFLYTNSLTTITVDAANPNYLSEDGVLFNKDKTTLWWYPHKKEGQSYAVPEGVVTIEEFAMYDNMNLKEISVPSTVTTIKERGLGPYELLKLSVNIASPISVNENVFPMYLYDYATCLLEVPVGSKAAYQAADVWKKFTNIEEKTFTGVTSWSDDKVTAYPNPFTDEVRFTLAETIAHVTITNLSGQTLVSLSLDGSDAIYLPNLQKGVYLLTIELHDGSRIIEKVIKK